MRNLLTLLNHDYRIIEFSRKTSHLPLSIRGNSNYLLVKSGEKKDSGNEFSFQKNDFISVIRNNGSDIIILNTAGFRELQALQRTKTATFLFQKITSPGIFFVMYFLIKSIIFKKEKYIGIYYLSKGLSISLYAGVERQNIPAETTRHFLSPLVPLEIFFHKLNDKEIGYCILRWFEEMPELQLNEDIDLLVSDNSLCSIHQIIDDRPGTIPFDIYSEGGIPGSDYHNMPYITLSLAEKVLKTTVLFKETYKCPTPEYYFYLLAYHVVFHKGEKSGLKSRKYNLINSSRPDHDYLYHLKRISSEANIPLKDFCLEELHGILSERGFAPPLDTQYKLSLHNEFLKSYLDEIHYQSDIIRKYAGLVCFVAREGIIQAGLFEDLKAYIQKEGFTILDVRLINDPANSNFTKHVRGGNWNRGPWPVSGGLPAAIIAAVDVNPIVPEDEDYELHPGLTNKRIINKNEIRDFINNSLPDRSQWFNGIHSSDNEIQALDYLTLAGIEEKYIYEKILHYRESFSTKYQVIEVLSRYSKRAKIELISYNGKKAIKKTFKPMCEYFLKNEINAYTIFKEKLPIAELIETGKNYILTSYIEGAKPLGRRISIKTLRTCLNILGKIYEESYSLLDFTPNNFLIDSNGKVYIIDFEFLYKYDKKPSFQESYDLVGIPENFNSFYAPNNRIQKGENQFNAIWTKYTGVHYDELQLLDKTEIHIKSFLRYYTFRTREELSKFKKKIIIMVKSIYNKLP